VAGLFCAGNRLEAFLLLQAMVNAGELCQRGKLYMAPGRELTYVQRAQQYGALWFTCIATPLRPVLAADRVVELTRRITAPNGLPPVRHALCYRDVPNKRIALIRVQPPPRQEKPTDLQMVLSRLQSQVNDTAFKVWSYFAMADGFVLTFLMWDAAEARELSLWLRRRPLVSELVTPPVEIPVLVRKTRPPP